MGDSWLETDSATGTRGMTQTRIERDPLGELPVPTDALWGIQTERARNNFPISQLRPLAAFVDACIWIKKAAALTHRETGRLEKKLADAIIRAADEVLAGGQRPHFSVRPPPTRPRHAPTPQLNTGASETPPPDATAPHA